MAFHIAYSPGRVNGEYRIVLERMVDVEIELTCGATRISESHQWMLGSFEHVREARKSRLCFEAVAIKKRLL